MVDELAPLHEHERPAPVRSQPLPGEAHDLVGDCPDLVGKQVSVGGGLPDPEKCWRKPRIQGNRSRLLEFMESSSSPALPSLVLLCPTFYVAVIPRRVVSGLAPEEPGRERPG